MTSTAPLDLRLLPAAVCAWGAALIVVHVSGGTAITLGIIAGSCAILGLVLLLSVPRSRWPRRGLSGAAPQVVPQVVLCAAVVAAAGLQAGSIQTGHDAAGWTTAVEADRPVEAEVRVTGDAVQARKRGFDGAVRLIAEAEVLGAELEDPAFDGAAHGGERSRQWIEGLDADVVLIVEVPEEAEEQTIEQTLRAGHRYRGLFRTAPTDAGERATALLFPFGGEGPDQLPADRWTEFTEVFNRMRTATAEASGAAVGDGPSLLPGLILGDRSLQSPELTEAMRISGLSHLTAVSGANCALVLGALLGTLRMLRAPRWTTVPVALVGLALFVMLVQPEPSVIRAAVMGSIGAMALFAGRGRASFSLLCVCVVGLLVFDPWFSVAPEFQLSVASTVGIVIIGTPIRRRLERVLPPVVAAPLALAFSAQLFVTPVLLPLAEGVNTYAVPANMLAAPLVPLITVPGTFAAVISTVLPGAATAILWGSGLAAAGIGLVGRWASRMPQALAPWPEGVLGVGLVVLYILACLILAQHLVGRRQEGAAVSAASEELDGERAVTAAGSPRTAGGRWMLAQITVVAAATGAVAALVVPSSRVVGHTTGRDWLIALCDVDQADMLVVRTGEHEGLVIDTGEDPELAHRCLRDLSVQTVATLMLTHEHRDHVGGVPGVLRGREVGEILHAGSADWDPEAELETGEEDAPPMRRAAVGDTGEVGDEQRQIRWQVWRADDHHAEPNDNSLVVLFELSETAEKASRSTDADGVGSVADPLRMLITGDLEEEQTRRALESSSMPRHVDVLSVAHHGAANGGTELMDQVRPPVALIGVGEENMYGHPAEVITDRLDELGATVYRTDVHGTVVLSLEEGKLHAETVSR